VKKCSGRSTEDKLAEMERDLWSLFPKRFKDVIEDGGEWLQHANVIRRCLGCSGELDMDGSYCSDCLYGGAS